MAKRRRHPERRVVVHAGAGAVGKGHVMNAALAVQPRSPQAAGILVFGVLGRAEAKVIDKSARCDRHWARTG